MKSKLNKFSQFASEVLPHEASYLLSIQNFEDNEKLEILRRIAYNCNHSHDQLPFDTTIDKRKYSHLKNWIVNKLNAIDVDHHFEWINEMDRKVMTDSILPDEEKLLLKAIQQYDTPVYYFIKFYELALNFRHFLLIRLRYDDHKLVNQFIEQYRDYYNKSKEVNEKMHQASMDIINQYSMNNTESRHWEQWLLDTFYDECLDGRNRYFAVVRLTFMYFNYREFSKLKALYEDLDMMLKKGVFYARRILFNYYANSVLLHSKFDVLQQAEEYGYLSIKQKNTDHLHYLNNYSAILLRQGKLDKALSLMKQALPEMRNTNNFHNKIGFVAFYIKCLNMNGQAKDAEKFAEGFLLAYKQQILSQRWHIFFVAYLQSLIMQEKYEEALRIIKKYDILEKDKVYQSSVIYLPTILWYNAVSEYMENKVNDQKLISILIDSGQPHFTNPHKAILLDQLLKELKPHIPHLFPLIKSNLNNKILNN